MTELGADFFHCLLRARILLPYVKPYRLNELKSVSEHQQLEFSIIATAPKWARQKRVADHDILRVQAMIIVAGYTDNGFA